MKKLSLMQEIKSAYQRGENIMRYLNKDLKNTLESILISYDFQTGSYIENYYNNSDRYEKYTDEISNYIKKYSCNENFNSIF